jgi:hypothetical protein
MKGSCILLIILAVMFISLAAPGHAWWNTSWSNRAPITINTTVNLTNFSYNINISSLTGMNNNFTDIRFVGYNNSAATETYELPYWIEENTSGSWASVWVMVNLTTLNGTQLYVYYGNTLAADTTGNGSKVFMLYDGFENNLKGNWYVAGADILQNTAGYARSGTYYINSSDSTDYNEYLNLTNTTLPANFAIEFWVWDNDNQLNGAQGEIDNDKTFGNGEIVWETGYPNKGFYGYYISSWINTGVASKNQSWVKMRWNRTGTTESLDIRNISSSTWVNVYSGIINKASPILAQARKAGTNTVRIDDAFVRDFGNGKEPTYGIGSGEASNTCTPTNNTAWALTCSDNCTLVGKSYNVTNVTTTGTGYLTLSSTTYLVFNTFFRGAGCTIAIDATSKFMRSPFS